MKAVRTTGGIAPPILNIDIIQTRVMNFKHLPGNYIRYPLTACGPGSSVGIATELQAGRSGIESRWGRDFPPVQTDPGTHPFSCTMGTGSFPGVN